MILDGNAIQNTMRFGANSSPGDDFTVPSGAPWEAGNLILVCQYAENLTGNPAIPADVIPPSYTGIGTFSGVNSTGDGFRVRTSYKIATSGDLGANRIGMNGVGRNRICAIIINGIRRFVDVTVEGQDTVSSGGGDPAAISVPGLVVHGLHIVVGFAHGQLDIPDASFVMAPDADGSPYNADADNAKGDVFPTRTYYSQFLPGVSFGSHSMNLANMGEFSCVHGINLRLD